MPLDANDLKQIGDLIESAAKKAPQAPPQNTPPATPQATPADQSTLDKAKEKELADNKRKQDLLDAESAAKFELGLEAFKKDNLEHLPKEIDYILSTVSGIESKTQKAKETKAAIMELFFKQEKNVAVLNDTQKAKAKTFIALTREAKIDSANQYWEVLELAIDGLKQSVKFEAARRASGLAANSGQDKYAEAVFARSMQLNLAKK